MTTTLELASRLRIPTDVRSPILPILIQVPALTTSARTPSTRRRSTRRRLRKEVRVAGLAFLSILPIGLTFPAFAKFSPTPAFGMIRTAASVETCSAAPCIALSFEPVDSYVEQTASVPVIFPGYLLPVDGPEESAHAGH